MINIANVRAKAALVNGYHRSAATATRVVDSVASAFHGDEVYWVAAIEYDEVRQPAADIVRTVAPPASDSQTGDE
jgi:hypothetical protein